MNAAAIGYLITAAVFMFIGVVAIDYFKHEYPDHELYDDEAN